MSLCTGEVVWLLIGMDIASGMAKSFAQNRVCTLWNGLPRVKKKRRVFEAFQQASHATWSRRFGEGSARVHFSRNVKVACLKHFSARQTLLLHVFGCRNVHAMDAKACAASLPGGGSIAALA